MKTVTINLTLPYEAGSIMNHSIHGRVRVISCREGGLFGHVILAVKEPK